MNIHLTNRQARQFLLRRHGLIGDHLFGGKEGVMSFIRRAGCVQYDPVDICGRNADIVLNSRVGDYKKEMLDGLLYEDRRLIDYFDKNLSIFPIENLPAFLNNRLRGGYAEAYDRRGGDAVKQIEPLIRRLIEERSHISAKEVGIDEAIEWLWGAMTSLPRAALESMYFRGELIVHHKTGTNKSYAFMKDHVMAEILTAKPPFSSEEERIAWHVRRRIGAVGMLWNKASDAWLGLRLKAAERAASFQKLLDDNLIFEVIVDGIKDALYICMDERADLEAIVTEPPLLPRAEFIAPLDSLMWDRKLVSAIFGFDYKWEIYTPQEKRKYGAYTLPILYGDSFIGRIDLARKTGRLIINNLWTENGKPLSHEAKASVNKCLKRFSELNECECPASV
ncbi:MAG: winged helix DNA-binding domain-containing protein [Oscillospiraceae bacterium]|jgi:uncharacterized protein YcaQ|nr:winged helix DNA-binding domain-containing protein [Oscillospiraceae bacterium]